MKKSFSFLKFLGTGMILGLVAISMSFFSKTAFAAGTTIKFTPVTINATSTTSVKASTAITYNNSTSGYSTLAVPTPKVHITLYKKGMLNLTEKAAEVTATLSTPKYNTATTVSASFTKLDPDATYWVTFYEVAYPSTVIKSSNFVVSNTVFKFGGGNFGGAGATAKWTETTTTNTNTTTSVSIPATTTPTPKTVPPPQVSATTTPYVPTMYELEFRLLPDAYLQTLKAKGSVKFTSTDGSRGVLAGNVDITPITYDGGRLETETFNLPYINMDSGSTYPLEFAFKQTIPFGVSISKVELGSLDDTGVYPILTNTNIPIPQNGVITAADGTTKVTFDMTSAKYDTVTKSTHIIGKISYNVDIFSGDKFNKIIGDIYDAAAKKIASKNIQFTRYTADNVLEVDFSVPNTATGIPTTYQIRDASIPVTSPNFKIDQIASTGNTTTNTTNTTNGSSTSNSISGPIQFSAVGVNNTGTKITGLLYPSVSGDDLMIGGELVYTNTNNATAARASTLGLVSFHLTDGDGVTSQIKATQLGVSGSLKYNTKYYFNVKFSNYNRYLDQSGIPTSQTIRKSPFKLRVVDDVINAKTADMVVVSASNSTASQNQSSSAITSTGDQIVFKLTNATANTSTGKLELKGSITYDKALTTAQINAKKNKISLEIFDKNLQRVATGMLNVASEDPKVLSLTNTDQMFGFGAEVDSYQIQIKENDAVVSSRKFDLDESGGTTVVNQSAAFSPQTVTAPNGTLVSFAITTPSDLTATATSLQVNGTVTYDAIKNDGKTIGKLALILTDKDNKAVTDQIELMASAIDDKLATPFTTSFAIDQAKAPYNLKVKDTGLNVTSPDFTFKKAGTGGTQNQQNNNQNPEQQVDTNGDGIINGADAPAAGSNVKRTTLKNPLKEGLNSIPDIVAVLLQDVMIPIAVPFLGLAIIWTGFSFVTARGNEKKIQDARNSFKWTIFGGAIILGAAVIAKALQATISSIVQ